MTTIPFPKHPTVEQSDQVCEAMARLDDDHSDAPRWRWDDLYDLTGPMLPGDFIVVGAVPGNGKALALDTRLPTPTGWTTMGAVKVGDQLLDERGQPCTVTYATDVQYRRNCFEVGFGNGEVIVADAEHLWWTRERLGNRSMTVKNTVEILLSMGKGGVRDDPQRHYIPIAGALKLPEAPLPLDPYILGVWLGDGTTNAAAITCADADAEIAEHLRDCGVLATRQQRTNRSPTYRLGFPGKHWKRDNLQGVLRSMHVLGNKHVPAVYLRASYQQRLALIQGLMDTDGSVSGNQKQCEFCSTNKYLADAMVELLRSVGLFPRLCEGKATIRGRYIGQKYRVMFQPGEVPVFRLRRKAERAKPPAERKTLKPIHTIVSVTPCDSVPVRCVQVSSPSALYLCGESMIPTHNTALMLSQLDWLASEGYAVLYAPLELDPEKMRRMWATWECGYPWDVVARGGWSELPEGAKDRCKAALQRGFQSSVLFAPERRLGMEGLQAWLDRTVRTLKGQRIGAVVIDHFHRMQHGADGPSFRLSVTEAVRGLKDLAREYAVPFIVACQLNRAGAHQVLDRYYPPTLDRLKETSALSEEADVVLMLSRRLRSGVSTDDVKLVQAGHKTVREFEEPGVMQITVRKHRLVDAHRDRTALLQVREGRVESRPRY